MKANATNNRRTAFAAAIRAAGLDLNKDFFQLSFSEISTLDDIRKSFKYSGKNNLGRSCCRQFWYSAQMAR
jgi:hypothetical protein